MIKNIIFDLGGIIFTIDEKQAVRRFKEIGLKNADEQLDPYRQSGYFGELESGKISAEEFRQELSTNIGPIISMQLTRAIR
jgi:putative hydrolase of the HAD superfamily